MIPNMSLVRTQRAHRTLQTLLITPTNHQIWQGSRSEDDLNISVIGRHFI